MCHLSILFILYNNFQNQRIMTTMLAERKSQIYVFKQGKLITKEIECQTQFSEIINYDHTVNPTPDEYHIEAIKQYRKQLQQLRAKYYQLQKAYYLLLGYKWQGSDLSRALTETLGRDYLKVAAASDKSERSTNMKKSQVYFNDVTTEGDQIKANFPKLSQSIIQIQTENLAANTFAMRQKGPKTTRNSFKTKTQTDQDIQIQLAVALKQIRDLKFALQQAHVICEKQVQEYKQSYEEHIKRLEQILERQRKHSKMLNGVINRSRFEVQSKDNLIKQIMELKSTDKNAVQKLVRKFTMDA